MGRLLSDEPQLFHLFCQTLSDLLIVGIYRPVPRHHDNVVAQHIALLRQAVGLPDAAANTVAYHGMAKLCSSSQAKTIVWQAVFAAIDHKTPTGRELPLLVQPAEQMILFKGT